MNNMGFGLEVDLYCGTALSAAQRAAPGSRFCVRGREQSGTETTMTRREFVARLIKSGLLVLAGSSFRSQAQAPTEIPTPDERVINVDDPAYRALRSVGGAVYFRTDIEDKPLIVWRQDQNTYRVFSSKCPHRGRQLRLPQNGLITCPFHNSAFDTNGRPVDGPALKPLREYPARLKGNKLVIRVVAFEE